MVFFLRSFGQQRRFLRGSAEISARVRLFILFHSSGCALHQPSHRITASIAFTAPRFQPSFTSHLLLAFVELVLIERVSISHAFPHMLGQSNKLGRHTDIILMLTETLAGGLGVTKYSWANIDHRPWGQNLPIQCPECGLVNSWRSASKAGAYLFECMKDGCRKLLRFDKPANARMLMQGKTSSSCWLAIELDSNA